MSRSGSALGPGLATALVAGNMIGSGIYLLPASLGAFGSISLLGWLGALAAAILFAAMFACAALMPSARGQGAIDAIGRAWGRDIAYVAAALYWLQALLGNVAIALAVTGYVAALAPWAGTPVGLVATTLAAIWATTFLNLVGARMVGRFEAASLLVGLLPVLLIGIAGWLYFDPVLFAAGWNVSGRPDAAVVPELVVLVLWAFLGLESASVAAGLVEDPQRNVPLATIGGVLLAAAIYIAASTALLGILPAAALAASTAPFADATSRIIGAAAGAFVACCAALKASGTLAGWLLLTAESGRACAAIDTPASASSSRLPRRQLLGAAMLMSVVVVATADASIAAQFGRLANAVVLLMLCFYGLAGAALLRMKPLAETGLGSASCWLGGAGLALSIAIVALQDWFTIAATLGAVLACVGARLVVRRRATRLRR